MYRLRVNLFSLTMLCFSTFPTVSSAQSTVYTANSTSHVPNPNQVEVIVNLTQPIRTIPASFLSIGLDSSIIRRHWCGMNFTRVGILAKSLQPGYMRLGGSEADFLIFKPDDPPFPPKPLVDKCDIGKYILNKNFSFPGIEWTKFYRFFNTTGLQLIFDINVLLRRPDNTWDMENAKQFLQYSSDRGFKMHFELGNEPSSFNHSVNRTLPAGVLAGDYRTLRNLLQQFPLYKESLLIGPSVTNVANKNSEKYLWRFLSARGAKFVDAVTFHQYYINGREAKLDNFTDPTILDSLKRPLQVAMRAAQPYNKSVWIGETASAWGGGAKGLSDTYVSGFMWLDKLGLSSLMGISGVIRQTIYHGSYALLNKFNDPNPDFWLSVLFKQLIGTKVYQITSSHRTILRLYAFSSKRLASGYVVAALNLGTHDISIEIQSAEGFAYILEPGDGRLNSSEVLCNGKLLKWPKEIDEQPAIVRRPFTGSVILPAKRFGFLEINSL